MAAAGGMMGEMDDALLLRMARTGYPPVDDVVKDQCLAVMRGERELTPELREAAQIVSDRGAPLEGT